MAGSAGSAKPRRRGLRLGRLIGGVLVDAARLSPLVIALTAALFGLPLALLSILIVSHSEEARSLWSAFALTSVQVVLAALLTTLLEAAALPKGWRRGAGPMDRVTVAVKAWPVATAFNLIGLVIYAAGAGLGGVVAAGALALTHGQSTSPQGEVVMWSGVICGLIPPLVFLARWSAATPLAVSEGPDFVRNLGRSVAMTHGRWTPIVLMQAAVPLAWAGSMALASVVPLNRLTEAQPVSFRAVVLMGLIGLTTALHALGMGRTLRELNETDAAGTAADLAAMFE